MTNPLPTENKFWSRHHPKVTLLDSSNFQPIATNFRQIIAQHKKVVIVVFLVTCSLITYLTITAQPRYLATSTIIVESNSNSFSIADQTVSPLSRFTIKNRITNSLEILKSAALAEKVLTTHPEILKLLKAKLKVSNFEPVTALIAGLRVRNLKDSDIIQIQYEATSPTLAQAVANAYATTYQQYEFEQTKSNVTQVRQFIQTQLELANRRLDSTEIALETFKRQHNLIALPTQTETKIRELSNLEIQLAQIKTQRYAIAEKINYLKDIATANQQILAEKLTDITLPVLTNLQNNLIQLELEHSNLLSQGYDQSHPIIRNLQNKINHTQKLIQQFAGRSNLLNNSNQLNNLSSHYNPLESFEQLELSSSAQIGANLPFLALESLQTIQLELEIKLQELKAQENFLNNTISQLRTTELTKLPLLERQLAQLTRSVEVNREIYSILRQRYEEAKIAEAGKIAQVRIVDLATKAGKVKPNIPLNIILGLILASLLAFGTAYALEYFDTTIKSIEEVEKILPVVLGNIPKIQFSKHTDETKFFSQRLLLNQTELEPQSAESFRILRTALLYSFSAIDEGVSLESLKNTGKIIIVTSPNPGEGKSTIAVNLAVVLAQAGNKTLLIDADLRRPILHYVFGRHRRPGLTDAIINSLETQTIYPTKVPNLFFLASGTTPPSPADILNSPKAAKLLAQLKQTYDFIIIDTPPVLVAADTAILVSRCDGVILTIRANRTTYEALLHSQKILQATGTKFIGGVVNCLTTPNRHRYYYYYRSKTETGFRSTIKTEPSLQRINS
ncbi:MAG: polysaccharide biosynthesis tyrosine autokinase [candidate division WOR-3 bacterium]